MSKKKKMAFDFMIFDDLYGLDFVNYVNNKIINFKKKITG